MSNAANKPSDVVRKHAKYNGYFRKIKRLCLRCPIREGLRTVTNYVTWLSFTGIIFFVFFFNKVKKWPMGWPFPHRFCSHWWWRDGNFVKLLQAAISKLKSSVSKICWKVMLLNFLSLLATLNQSILYHVKTAM